MAEGLLKRIDLINDSISTTMMKQTNLCIAPPNVVYKINENNVHVG